MGLMSAGSKKKEPKLKISYQGPDNPDMESGLKTLAAAHGWALESSRFTIVGEQHDLVFGRTEKE